MAAPVRSAAMALACAVMGALAAPERARAQTDAPLPAGPVTPNPVTEGAAVYLEADTLIEDRGRGVYLATGGVEARSGDRVLTADELEYDPQSGRVVARGDVRIHEGGAPAQLADEVVLGSDFSEGVALGFATLLENNGRAAAAFAIRRADGSVELSNAYYTACDLCEEERPTWRLRASRVVRDLDDQMIYYRDARLEVLGAPILYTPVFAHPDPSTPAKSGFLIPTVDVSNRLGVSYQQPYLWVVSPYQDLVIAPRVMGEVNPLLGYDYRKRFYSGEINLEGSVTYEQEFDEDGKFGDEDWRWHVFGDGLFRIDDVWRWGFGVQAASEDLYLRRYDYDEFREETNAVLQADDRRLISQVFVKGRGERFYADAAAGRLQSLLENEDDDRLPAFAPVGELRARLPAPAALGRFGLDASTAVLRREDGADYARLSAGFDWERPTILPFGARLEPFALGRADIYALDPDVDGAEEDDFTRTLGLVGADLSYPLVRDHAWGRSLITPRLQVIAASSLDAEDVPPNEDSLSIDLDRSLLFARTRAAGYDVWEEGSRLDAGVTFAAEAGIRRAEVFLGRSVRLDGDAVFGEGSGLAADESDWVAEIEVDLGAFEIATRNRFDAEDGSVNRTDLDARASWWRLSGDLTYTRFSDDEIEREVFEQAEIALGYAINKRWSLSYRGLYDADENELRRQQASLIYSDECTDLRLVYERDTFRIGDLGPSESLTVQVTLFTLGSVQDD